MTAATSRLRRRGIGAGVAALVGLSGLGFAAMPAQAAAGFNPAASQVAGVDRFDTAARIATSAFTTAPTVVVANGDRAIDAQAGAYVAGLNNAPILLTQKSSVPTFTVDAIKKLGATKAIVLGDSNSVDATALAQMTAAGLTVTVVAGADRFETAADIYNLGTTKASTVFLARADLLAGQVSPDALAASPLSYDGTPVLLTNAGSLPQATADAIKNGGVKNVVVLGNAITDSVKTAVTALGATVTTIAGDDRSLTAQKIADYGIAQGKYGKTSATIANGDKIDALAAGPWAAKNMAPILLTLGTNSLGTGTSNYLTANSSTLTKGTVFGDASSVPATLTAAAKTAGGGDVSSAAVTGRPQLTSASIVSTVTAAQTSASNPAGTRVRFTYSEALQNNFAAANFKVYNAAGAVETGATATLESSGNSVLVNFTNIATSAAASALTVATNANGAVTDTSSLASVEGSVALGVAAGGNTSLPAGVTAAPDLLSVGNFREAATSGNTVADFTFDSNAFVLDTNGATAGLGNGFNVVLSDGQVVSATVSQAGDSGGTAPGGSGTTVVTASFANPTLTGTSTSAQLSTTNVVRGFVTIGAVSTAASGGTTNPAESVDVSASGTTTGPDLVSVTPQAATNSTDVDRVLYTFDAPVAITAGTTSAAFSVYSYTGASTTGTSAAVAVNSSNRTQVSVTFPNGTLSGSVGATVAPASVQAVQSTGDPLSPAGATNVFDGVKYAGTITANTAGRTAGPDLTGVKLSSATDQFGASTYQVDYTFDKANTGTPTAANFKLVLADGTVLVGSGTATKPTLTGDAANTVVRLTSFTVGTGSTDATQTQISSAVLASTVAAAATDGTVTSAEGVQLLMK